MRAGRFFGLAGLCALALGCSPAGAQPLKRNADFIPSAQTVSAAAARIASPFGVVTSTFRTAAHNREVGGVPDSYHLLGQAIDVARRPGITHARIAAALSAAGSQLVESLDEGDHSHFAFGRRAQQRPPTRPVKPTPAPPPQPRVAADVHGMLRADLSR